MLRNSLFYWEYSLQNKDPFPDPYYINDVIIIDPKKHKNFLNNVNHLRDLVTTYCCLLQNGLTENVDQVFKKIKDILLSVNNINYTEFVAYWKTLDTEYGTFKEIPNQDELLQILLEKFCERRRVLYEKYGYTHTSIQALYDSGSSRGKGQKFKPKIKDLTFSILRIEPIFINKNNWKQIREKLKLKYQFGNSHQNKVPDFYIQYKNHHIIGEAKHIHSTGGAQDKQISELIDFIRQTEEGNIHYLSFLDGLYFNRFSQKNLSEKLKKQKQDIEKSLEEYPKNFFVNTNGFRKLLEDLKNE